MAAPERARARKRARRGGAGRPTPCNRRAFAQSRGRRRRPTRPARVARRPDPADWRPDELLSLVEAAALCFPAGPIRVSALRTAIRRGELAWVRISGRLYTTPAAVTTMAACRRSRPATKPAGSGEDWDAYLATLLPDGGGRRC